jgi:hypothetical protein
MQLARIDFTVRDMSTAVVISQIADLPEPHGEDISELLLFGKFIYSFCLQS